MIVCLCHAINDKQLREAAKDAKNLKELIKKTEAGTGCGACIPALVQQMKDIEKDQEQDLDLARCD